MRRKNNLTDAPITETNLDLKLFRKGKVRDVYEKDDNLLLISTDRLSAFDVVLPTGIPRKGEALNRISAYWFDQTKDIIPNHMIEVTDPRSMLVKKSVPVRAEFIVRGYLYGYAWRNYEAGKPISGVELPSGMRKAEKLPDSILTPTTKADSGHDEEVTQKELEAAIGKDVADAVGEACLKIYERCSKMALDRGIVIADTKFEFGHVGDELILIDEALTPDSSRFWDIEKYEVGGDPYSFDKQYVRDYLTSIGWNKEPPAPELPDEVVAQTSARYVECFERVTGMKL